MNRFPQQRSYLRFQQAFSRPNGQSAAFANRIRGGFQDLGSQDEATRLMSQQGDHGYMRVEDGGSICSDSTHMTETIGVFKNELCDVLKTLVDNNTKSMQQLIDSVSSNNKTQVNEKAEEIEKDTKEDNSTKFDTEIQDIKNSIKDMRQLFCIKVDYLIGRLCKKQCAKRKPTQTRNKQTEALIKKSICKCALEQIDERLTRKRSLEFLKNSNFKCKCIKN